VTITLSLFTEQKQKYKMQSPGKDVPELNQVPRHENLSIAELSTAP
jgi:hypothetical protein